MEISTISITGTWWKQQWAACGNKAQNDSHDNGITLQINSNGI